MRLLFIFIPVGLSVACAIGHRSAFASPIEKQLSEEIEAFVEADQVAPPTTCSVLFVGSSSIRYWSTLAQDMAPLPVINRGFGGAHIEHVNRWFDQLVAPYAPRMIVFYAGENDIAAGKAPTSVISDFDAFMARKRTALRDVPVFFISLKPSKLRFAQLGKQREVNAAIRGRAQKHSDLHYIDVVSPMLNDGRPRDLYRSDDLHMTSEGYAIWTRVVRAALLPNAESSARNCASHEQPTSSSAIAGAKVTLPRRLRARGFEWDHEIQIALPKSYATTKKAYPVLWVTDGFWLFERAVRTANDPLRKHVPEMIVVAVGAPREEARTELVRRRTYDFSPTEKRAFEGFGSELFKQEEIAALESLKPAGISMPKDGAGAPGFLAFLVDVVRPVLSREYRMSGDHTLFGDSGGGTFCTYALFSRPDAFDKYICGSPALYWGNHELFRMEETYSKLHKDLPVKVFFGAGEAEVNEGGVVSGWGIVSSMTRMAEILQLRRYPSLKLHVRIFPSENHASVVPITLRVGLQTLWEDEASGCPKKAYPLSH